LSLVRPSAGTMCTRTIWSYRANVEAQIPSPVLTVCSKLGHPVGNRLRQTGEVTQFSTRPLPYTIGSTTSSQTAPLRRCPPDCVEGVCRDLFGGWVGRRLLRR